MKECIINKVALKNKIAAFFWMVAVIAFMFQCFYRPLAGLIVPSLIAFLVLEIPNVKIGYSRRWVALLAAYLLFVLTSALFSILKDYHYSTIARFLMILTLIPFAEHVIEPNFDLEWNIFKILSSAKAVMILYIWMLVFIQQDYQEYRSWAYANGSGDIYILGGIPRVQLLGTSLFVLAAIVEIERKKKITLYSVLMLAGALAAGNSAYILGIGAYFAIKVIPIGLKWIRDRDPKAIIVLVIFAVALVAFIGYSVIVLRQKAEFSNVVRKEQWEVLTEANPLLGEGIGHKIYKVTSTRVYEGDTYFEMQTLYIFNQIGLIGLALFYMITVGFYWNRKQSLIVYLVYLIYTFWNPYCFDSTHIIAVLLISNHVGHKEAYEIE